MKILKNNPWTTFAGLIVLILAGIDIIKNGIHTENSAMAAVGVGLLKSADSKPECKNDKTK